MPQTTGMITEPSLTQQTLFPDPGPPLPRQDPDGIHRLLTEFDQFGSKTVPLRTLAEGRAVDSYVNEFWTSKQRAANSLHEISYRACFKPQLPRFFIERLTEPGDIVYYDANLWHRGFNPEGKKRWTLHAAFWKADYLVMSHEYGQREALATEGHIERMPKPTAEYVQRYLAKYPEGEPPRLLDL